MKFENEYMPDTSEMDDVVRVLDGSGRAMVLDAPDDDADPVDEESEEPHADYD